MISCEGSNLPRFEEFVRVGPKPMVHIPNLLGIYLAINLLMNRQTRWAQAFHCSEQFSLYLAMQSNSLPEDQQKHLRDIEHISDTLKELLSASDDSLSRELTDSEKHLLELQALLAEELKLVVGAGSNLKNVVNNGLERVMQWLDTRLEGIEASDALVRVVEGLSIQNNDGSG